MYHYFTCKAQSAEAGEGGMTQMPRKLLNVKMIGLFAVLLVLFMTAGVAEEERTDASGQWTYVLEDGGAKITGYVEEPSGDLVIPGELDGYPVTKIGEKAFFTCRKLKGVIIPDGVMSIGNNAFSSCDWLTGVSIPDGVTSIGDGAFSACARLESVILPDSVTSIGDGAFRACRMLASVNIPDGVTSIGDDAFRASSLTSVSIPDSVTSIGNNAFDDCRSLISVNIPDSVTSIGDNAFANCFGLTSVTIPGSVTSIGTNPFSGHTSAAIHVSPDNPTYAIIDGVLFDKQQKNWFPIPALGKARIRFLMEYYTLAPRRFLSIGT